VVATSGSSPASPSQGRRPAGAGFLRTGGSQAGNGHDGIARVKQNRRPSRPLAVRPPTGTNSCRCMTTATAFNRHPTSCPRPTSTASDRCRTQGHSKAARWPDSERLRADTRKTPLQGGKAADPGSRFPGRGSLGTREQPAHEPLISRATLRATLPEGPLTGLSFGASVAQRTGKIAAAWLGAWKFLRFAMVTADMAGSLPPRGDNLGPGGVDRCVYRRTLFGVVPKSDALPPCRDPE